MFLVFVNYMKPIEAVERLLDDHVSFLDKYYEQRKFIFSGRRNPRVGGVILVNEESMEKVQQIVSEDPFFVNEIAQYEIIEFLPTKYDERFSWFLNGTGK